MHDELVRLQTARLLLRDMTLADLDFVAEMLGDPRVMRFYPKQYSHAESQVWIERQLQRYEQDGHGLWLAVDKESEQPIGQVGLLNQRVEGEWEAEIGYLIHWPFWRRGYATEAALAVRDHAIRTLHWERVISLIRPENTPSQRVARRIGMLPEREVVFAGLPHILFALMNSRAALQIEPIDDLAAA